MRIENGISSSYYSPEADVNVKETAAAVAKEAKEVVKADAKRTDADEDNIISDEMLDDSVKQANKNLSQYNKVIERYIHEKTHTIMYVVRDTLTNEIIREFPPRKIQDMIAKMWEIAGILVDERR